MKKILTFVLAVVFIIAFCGCGAEENSSTVLETDTQIIVSMYDYSGNVIRQWGDVDMAYGDENETHIYLNDGSYINIIEAPIVVIEEQGG